MGKIIIQGSGGGGLDLDEITARASDVLKGKTTIDSDGEVVDGAIERRGTGGQNALKIGKNSDSISVSFSAGYYEKGNSNDTMPYVKVPYSLLSQTLELNANKMLENYSVAGVRGTIRVSKTNKNHVKTMNEGFVWSDDRGLMYVIRTDDNYYIPPVSEGGYNYVGVAEPDLKPENIITGKTIGRVKGSIPVKGGTSHNTNGTRGGYDPPTQRFYCDIERGAYINNCWSGYPEIGIHRDVFIQNLGIRPELLRQGYSLFGVQGTLPDYASGRVVFNGATFDGVLVSGVADNQDKTLVTYNQSLYLKNISDQYYAYEYWGIRDGGLRFYAINRNGYSSFSGYRGIVFDHSIDLSPFKKVKLVFHKWGNVRGTPNGFGRADLDLFLGKLSEIKRNNNIYNNCKSKNITNVTTSETSRHYFDDWETVEVDIAEDVGQHYVGIGINANGVYAYDQSEMNVVITYVEFIN